METSGRECCKSLLVNDKNVHMLFSSCSLRDGFDKQGSHSSCKNLTFKQNSMLLTCLYILQL